MTKVLVLSSGKGSPSSFLPSVELLDVDARILTFEATSAEIKQAKADVAIIDGTTDLLGARNCAQFLKGTFPALPLLLVLQEGGFAALTSRWLVDDFIVNTAGPAELEARLRLLPHNSPDTAEDSVIHCGVIRIDEGLYSARLNGHPLNLTYKEFELLKFFAQNPGRVFTRAQLLSEVWGNDYFGGTRTVDVHVRRLRSKLGNEHEQLISTVRNVGYSFEESRSSAQRQ